MSNNLAADIYCDATGKKWTARITRLLPGVLKPIVVWERDNMRSQWNAETAMEAAWQRLQAADAASEQADMPTYETISESLMTSPFRSIDYP